MFIVCKVYQNNTAKESNNRLFERFVEWSDDIAFPYQNVISSLLVLFPKSIVTFEVHYDRS